jgi:DNA-binding transcriptional LysR family regulator
MTRVTMTHPAPNLAAMDLNLLVAFEALWLERNVTAAGRRLGLSQPATSGALARLRQMLGDRLFVRGKRGLEPTSRCSELAGPLCKALVDLRNVVAGSAFDPATTTRTLTIGAVDAAIAVILPKVLRETMAQAPNAQVRVVGINPARATEALLDGAIDLALSPRAEPSASVRLRALYPIEFVVAVRPGHPWVRRPPSRDGLAAFPRVHVSFEGQQSVKAAVVLSSFLAVTPVLAQSDGWALLPRPFAEQQQRTGALRWFVAPVGVAPPGLQMHLLWPDAQDASPASRWLRELVVAATR